MESRSDASLQNFNLIKEIEVISRNNWNLLNEAESFNISFSETTLTDLILLQLAKLNSTKISVSKSTIKTEAEFGFDWEMWIKFNQNGWVRFSIQAKKLDAKSSIYKSLRHSVKKGLKKTEQISLLEIYSKKYNSIPLYCFYNYIPEYDVISRKGWHCCQDNFDFNYKQLGCTLVRLDVVKKQYAKYKKKNFENLHPDSRSLPLRCIFSCPNFMKDVNENPLISNLITKNHYSNDLPDYLLRVEKENMVELPIDCFSIEVQNELIYFYPKYIFKIDLYEQFDKIKNIIVSNLF